MTVDYRRLDEQVHRSLVLWAADCAEHVLPYFEEKYPNHDRPRKALEAGRAWVLGVIAMSEARAAALAAHIVARGAGRLRSRSSRAGRRRRRRATEMNR